MSHFFPCLLTHYDFRLGQNILLDDIYDLLDSIRSICESNCRFMRWNGRLRKETVIHHLISSRRGRSSKYISKC
ncbi:hypothetical protein LINPERPRIM_LOCUS40307, partial [Linum perenne]